MTGQQLTMMRNDIAFRMIEANDYELKQLEQELNWIEELINEQEKANGKENNTTEN